MDTRKKIFSVVVRGKTHFVRAIDAGAIANILTQMAIPHRNIQRAPGNSKRAKNLNELRDAR